MKIGRTLFWFHDGKEQLAELDDYYFAYGTLLNRLMNKVYDGKKIKFININFLSNQYYKLYPVIPKNEPYYHGGHLTYYGEINFSEFNMLDKYDQKKYVWDKAYKSLVESSVFIKNEKLKKACDYAYKKGIENDLNPDYKVLEENVNLKGKDFIASVWINFHEDHMSSKFTLEIDGKVIYEKIIDRTKNGIEIFLEIYKKIENDDSNIIIKGRSDIDGLPLKISIEEALKKYNFI